MSRKQQVKQIILICIVLALVIVLLFSGLRILESTVLAPPDQEEAFESRVIQRDGVSYYPRQDIKVFMVLGIDEFGEVKDSGSYNNTGEADMVALVVFDETNSKVDVLSLNRDTMLEMPVLGIGGKQAGTKVGQLALSHTYGSGLEDSCENTKKAVSDYLMGLEIDYYVSLNMDAIALLTDAVGGVAVTVEDDFSTVDPSIPMGPTVLSGEQALSFVRVRKDVGDQMNLTRMERHKAYMNGFITVFKQAYQTDGFMLELYEQLSPYMVTDCPFQTMNTLMNRYANYSLAEITTPEAGRNDIIDGHYGFYADEQALDRLIVEWFYSPIS